MPKTLLNAFDGLRPAHIHQSHWLKLHTEPGNISEGEYYKSYFTHPDGRAMTVKEAGQMMSDALLSMRNETQAGSMVSAERAKLDRPYSTYKTKLGLEFVSLKSDPKHPNSTAFGMKAKTYIGVGYRTKKVEDPVTGIEV